VVGTTIRSALLIAIFGLLVRAQAPVAANQAVPSVMTFVSPPYPRAAKDQRMQGKTLTSITVDPDGRVTEARTISAHPVFERYVLEALKQWRFQPSDHPHTLQVTCLFELTDDKCEGTDKHPITSETSVSAELPATVHIKTGLQCVETSVN
jgi:TonB family protein